MSNPNLAKIDYLREIAEKLTNAGFGEKAAIIKIACDYLQLSRPQLYRELETVGYKSGRKQRSDKGKSVVSVETAELVGGMVISAMSKTGKKRMPINLALEIAQDSGKAPKVSAATISRVMKQNFCHPVQLTQPTAHHQQRSLHPNHVWEVDASVCVVFYLNKKAGLHVMDEREFYKNKPANLHKIEKDRVIRYVQTDHASGSFYHEYFWHSENVENLTNFFFSCIQKRSLKEPMHGVPFILYVDKGTANTSGMFRNLLERLDVQFIPHATNNSRAKGQVEQANNLIETQFESLLSYRTVNSIEELNTFASEWRTMFNETKIHSRTKRTRNAVWQMIRPEQLRIAPSIELCRELVSTVPVPRTVKGDLTIQHTIKGYGEQFYSVRHIDGIYVGAKVDVVVNPYRAPDIDVLMDNEHGEQVIYTVEPDQYDIFGQAVDAPVIGEEIRSMPDSKIDQSRKRIMKQAYNADTQADVDKAIKKRTPAYQGQIDPTAHITKHDIPDYLPRAGEQMHTETSRRQVAPINLIQAAKQIRGLVGDLWTAECMAALKKSFPTGEVPQDVIPEIAEGIKATAEKPKLRVVGE
ncbi:transposase [Acinetobacter sp. V102_4]|uniref:transposase n=1 Tax=Acinetobacter sp. V102_4 TaxID=3072984 RepID=UPI00287DE04F|nr:transposase [Acinetobacter sp. V102_4]MDS7929600.1 transposase [Acinetobacter sp. V102_4]